MTPGSLSRDPEPAAGGRGASQRAQAPLLECRQVSKAFSGKQALESVSLVVDEGEVVGLIGPNGSGKTTLLKLIVRREIPDQGTIHFGGRDIGDWPPEALAGLGIVRTFQDFHLFGSASVFENLLIGAHSTLQAGSVAAVLRTRGVRQEERELRLRAQEWLLRVGLDDMANQPAEALSTGQRRLLEVARACMAQPRLLLLDEPAAGLNPRMTERVVTVLRSLKQDGVSMVLVEHKVQMISALSDHVVVLDSGRKLAEGTPSQIRRDPAVIRSYFGSGV